MVTNWNVGHKLKFWSQIEMLVTNWNVGHKLKCWLQIEMLVTNWNVGKEKNSLVKILNFDQKLKILYFWPLKWPHVTPTLDLAHVNRHSISYQNSIFLSKNCQKNCQGPLRSLKIKSRYGPGPGPRVRGPGPVRSRTGTGTGTGTSAKKVPVPGNPAVSCILYCIQ